MCVCVWGGGGWRGAFNTYVAAFVIFVNLHVSWRQWIVQRIDYVATVSV